MSLFRKKESRKKVVIHIGTYKTATTSIQHALYFNQDAHRNIRYLKAGMNHGLKKHLKLYDSLIDDGFNTERRTKSNYTRIKENMIQEIETSEESTFVISEEELSYPDSKIAEGLKFLKEIADVYVVMLVRKQDKFLDSLYRQFIKEPARNMQYTFDEFCQDPVVCKRADYHYILSLWIRVFGEDCVFSHDFDEMKKGKGVIHNFFTAIGEEYRGGKVDTYNESISPAKAEVVRRIGMSCSALDRHKLVRYIKSINEDATALRTYLNDRNVYSIMDKYTSSNDFIRGKYNINFESSAGNLITLEEFDSKLRSEAFDIIIEVFSSYHNTTLRSQEVLSEFY